ncbi:MAG: pimeloyl-[acyl-carrier protein] methyl ester esterase [gamma proteobacterium symbiont of Ctena orbiculata]|nr:pimeloyl-ACP methyl ester esterase BioH [Candidatus Thiodiazotropha taylori]PUB84068.1 MAG: pimeloyl-[acyl-carrier protein] methyl ester esterase [gamma proteobacterium symbiont of Ctena orbiculata]PVV07010.1 MAG: pimeloyl-[acyl-carrier protein] methyl ester esterase [gamma proteobacterium symbiont of Ctena orbiculata]PVV09525.1 MAG: pimeloyl-[acyl-carrier protein] methyl ester esterase [gamma proteobacterium symbiont of Ctena orbiculata]PVV22261.1 MAG: pimeloyl-[acyl-carrier protein] methyl
MRLATERQGEGAKLVLLHGWGMNSSVWAEFAEGLAEAYQVTRIDLPGHGHSPFGDQQKLTAWAAACLDVAPERAVWIGWSLGSMVVLQSALLAPSRVEGVVAMAGMPRFVKALNWQHAMAAETLDQFIQNLRRDHRQALERFLALQMMNSDRATLLLRRLKSLLRERPDPAPEALQSGLELLKSVDLRERLVDLRCPTSWIYGSRDTLAPPRAGSELRRWLPQAAVHIVKGAGHTPFLSHPEETTQLLRRSLESMHG